MLPRIWVVLLALALLGTPFHSDVFVDVTAEHADDEAAIHVETVVLAGSLARTVCMPPDDDIPTAPARTRVFRPPRPVG